MSNHIDPKIQEITNALTASTRAPWSWDVKNPEQNKYGGYDVGDLIRKTGEKTAIAILTILPNKHGVDVISAFSIEDANLIANAPEYIAYLLSQVERLQEENERLQTENDVKYDQLQEEYEILKNELDSVLVLLEDRAALSHLKGE